MQEAENVQAVIDRDDDDILLLREIGAVVQQVIARADAEAAAVQPYHDRPRFAVETRREDIEREAVLALRGMSVQRGHDRRRLLGARLDRRGERDLEVILD